MENPHRQADVTDQDSRGNTVLHTLVEIADDTTENTDMIAGIYDQILIQHFKSEARAVQLEAMENKQGLTPLKLAAKLGKIGVGLISATCFSFRVCSHTPVFVVGVGGSRRAASSHGSSEAAQHRSSALCYRSYLLSPHPMRAFFVISHPFLGSCFGTSCTGNSQMKG